MPSETSAWTHAVEMLRSIACCEAVLDASGFGPHQWERRVLGDNPHKGKRPLGSGGRTRGTMGRTRSGQRVASASRLAHWETLYPGQLRLVSKSTLWPLLRTGALLSDWKNQISPEMEWAVFLPLGPIKRFAERPVTEAMVQEVASFGSFEAIAIVLALLLDEDRRGRKDDAFLCGQYLPAALALLSRTSAGRKVALPLFAMLRQRHLDALQFGNKVLNLTHYDLFAIAASAEGILTPQVTCDPLRRRAPSKPTVSEKILEWIAAHRVEAVPKGACEVKWGEGLAPSTHRCGPYKASPPNRYHLRGQIRLSKALGAYV